MPLPRLAPVIRPSRSRTRQVRAVPVTLLACLLVAGCAAADGGAGDEPTAADTTAEEAPSRMPSPTASPTPSVRPGSGDDDTVDRRGSVRVPAVGMHTGEVVVSGLDRSFELYVPASFTTDDAGVPRADGPAPLVIALHGFSHSPEILDEMADLTGLAEQLGVAVAFGRGVGASWNGGAECCGLGLVDDVADLAYLRSVVDATRDAIGIDPSRVVLTGFSNGGYLAHRVACIGDGLAAGIVSESGVLAIDDCGAPPRLGIVHVHGEQDDVIPIGLGRARAQRWVDELGCDPFVDLGGDGAIGSPTTAEATGCRGTDAGIRFVSVPDLAHDWHPVVNEELRRMLRQFG